MSYFEGGRWFFEFRSLEDEIWARRASSLVPARHQVEFLWHKLMASGLLGREIAQLKLLWSALEKVDFDLVYPNYLVHPLRVAHSLTLFPEILNSNIVSLALCHNFRELAANPLIKHNIDAIEAGFLDVSQRNILDLLFTNREMEHDEVYLESYFRGIVDSGRSIILLKGCDKLDNHLTYAFENLNPIHHQTVKRFMVPALESPSPRLAEYLKNLVDHVEIPRNVTAYKQAATIV